MKNLFKAALLLAACLLPLHAQEAKEYGFLNIANLIPGEAGCMISIGGEELAPDGIKSSNYTGWFMVESGAKTLSITCEGYDKASGSIEIVTGAGNLIAIYLEHSKRLDADGKPYPPKIRIKSFPTYTSKGYGLKFVSMCAAETNFQLGPLKITPKQFEPTEIPKWSGKGFEIFCNSSSIGSVTGASESGAFYLLVANDHNGAHASVLVSSNNQEVPEYLKKPIKEEAPDTETSQSQP